MYINCISCGHKFDVGRSYDDYDGFVRCSTCHELLHVKTQDGNVRSVRPGSFATVNAAVPAQPQAPAPTVVTAPTGVTAPAAPVAPAPPPALSLTTTDAPLAQRSAA